MPANLAAFAATLAAVLATVLLPVAAAAAPGPEFEVGGSYDRLSGSYAPWTSDSVLVKLHPTDHSSVYGQYVGTSRFGLHDDQVVAGVAGSLCGLGPLDGQIEATWSPTHQVVSVYSLMGLLSAALGRGWVFTTAVTGTEYAAHASLHLGLTPEYYVGNWRFADTVSVSALQSEGVAAGESLEGDYWYGDRSFVGLSLGLGNELEEVAPGKVVLSTVTSAVGSLHHEFRPGWIGVVYLTAANQAPFYSYTGLSLALQHAF